MTREEIIQGLQFTIDMFLLNPTTGETYTEPINDMDKTTIDACKGAIKLLKEESEKDEVILTKKEYGELVSSEFDNGYAKGFREALEQEPCEDAVSRQAVLDVDFKRIVLTTANAIIIPEGATNGNMVETMFPYGKYGTNGNEVHVFGVGGNGVLVFTLEWWNAPYKAESEDKE